MYRTQTTIKIHILETRHQETRLTACSKSIDMPIDNTHWNSAIPSTLQTSVLHLNRVCNKAIQIKWMRMWLASEK